MTDNEIIKALECCEKKRCVSCPYDDVADKFAECSAKLVNDALDLINRQKAEIAELEAEIDKQYEQAKADILGNMSNGGTSCHWCVAQHESRAIEEFAERLKKQTRRFTEYDEGGWGCTVYVVKVEDIDNIVKEMTEDVYVEKT